MGSDDLDELDYGILQLLQRDARNQTPVDMAERLPVTDTTIRNRIEGLEEEGIIEGYVPVIDYESAGFPFRLQFICTAPIDRRSDLAAAALEISRVVRVDEMLTARENVRPVAVTEDTDDVREIGERLDELGLTIERECLLQCEHVRPFDHFGADVVSGD